ncbi:MAG: Carbamoyltransferase [Enterovirga sp.]|nr:Carbamoyltransferase [Enterovirga sp.]
MRYYLGLATTFHDPALAILGPDGEVLFAEAAERPLQYKRAPNCEPDLAPRMASLLSRWVPDEAEIVVATSWSQEFSSFLDGSARTGAFRAEAIAALSPELNRSFVPERSERALIASLHLQQRRAGLGTLIGIDRAGGGRSFAGLRRYGHHLSHAAYGCWSSPFEEAACLVVDGMGETGASALYGYEDGRLRELKRHRGRGSVGFFFGLVTDLAGFDQAAGEEWKIMGLAPYGRRDPELMALLRRLYAVDGGRLAFADAETVRAVAAAILARRPADAGVLGWADLARCGQDAFEEMMDALVAQARALSGSGNLVLAGGCALNSSFNGKAVGRHGFDRLHVPSAPADDGNAIGAAWLAYAADHPGWRPARVAASPYLGSTVSTEPLERMTAWEPRLRRLGHDGVTAAAAEILADGKLVGWVQGRAEFGPRALGNRSILADPRPADAKALLNAKVKYREAFRPFAPSILAEHGSDWFESYQDSPYMERTLVWRPEMRSRVPAVVHEDGTGRLQSVTAARNRPYAALIRAFAERTGVPILLNTSFNVMGKPILHTAEDAILMFYTTGLDAIAVEDWLLTKQGP